RSPRKTKETSAMSSPFVAEIRMWGCNFPPKGWAFCNGQLLPISQNTALFSLCGTYYGGDGKSTFALPDLQGATPVQSGQGNGLSDRFQGESGGAETVTLLATEMPQHTHTVSANNLNGTQNSPESGVWATSRIGRQGKNLYATAATGVAMSFQAVAVAGSSF